MGTEKRQHKRFSATAFLNKPIHLWPLPPYFGHQLKGRLIDLSAGGMAILIEELIPEGTFLNLKATFPDLSLVESVVNTKHVFPRGKNFLHGFEFLTLSPLTAEKIDRMSNDYINCESRIQAKALDICHSNCAFYSLCNKTEKVNPVVNLNSYIDVALEELKKQSVEILLSPNPAPLKEIKP